MIDDKVPEAISEFANADTDLGVALHAFRKGIERDFQVCFPACVYSYDRYTHIAEVMPLIKVGYFTGEQYEFIRRKPITVAVRQICCGGISLDFPLFVGDTGWVISSDRDTSLLKQFGALTSSALARDRLIKVLEDEYQQVPNQPLIHDFTQGFFIPDNWSRWEYWRYKDAPQVPIGNSIYIGSSFDSYEKGSGTNAAKYQRGGAYENKKTSSLVLNPEGNAVLACSKSESDGNKSVLELTGDEGEILVRNAKTGNRVRLSVSEKDGIVMRSTGFEGSVNNDGVLVPKQVASDAIFKLNRNEMSVRVSQGSVSFVSLKFDGSGVSLSFSGDLNILCDGKANVQSSEASVAVERDAMINVGGDVDLNAFGANVNCGNGVRINAGGEAKIVAGTNASIDAGNHATLAAIGSVQIAGGSRVRIESAGDVDLTTRAGGSINLKTVYGGFLNLTTEDYGSNINITAEKARMSVFSEKRMEIGSNEEIIMAAPKVSIIGDNYLNLRSPRYNLDTSRWMWNGVDIVRDMEDGLAIEGGGYLGNEDMEIARKKYLDALKKRRDQNKKDDMRLAEVLWKQEQEWEKEKQKVMKERQEALEKQAQYEADARREN